ncbi:MAG: hypothetical protein HN403_19520 [Rhodospirillales bacterium]|nr:hypothetical protein [Rhodospirillales bacterium]
MRKSAAVLSLALFTGIALLSGCAQKVGVSNAVTTGDSGPTVTGFTTFPDMPMAAGGEIDVDKTLIFGAGEGWFGRLVINASNDSGQMFNFYKESLPGFGWQEITSIRAATSVLTYSREERIATIQIEGRTLRGSEVSITVSPRGIPQGPATGTMPVQPVQ